MEKMTGTVVRGLRAPIIREGDNIGQIVIDTVLKAAEAEGFSLDNRDIIAVTESVVARAQGNYASVNQISADVAAKFGKDATIGVIFPILSRNRFAISLKGIAKASKKIILMLSYPSDEVGNNLVSIENLDDKGINPWTDVLTETAFRANFGSAVHPFTGVDYIKYYSDLIKEAGAEVEVIFSNNADTIVNYTKKVLTCDIHTRFRSKKLLKEAGAEIVYGLDDILTTSVNGSGYNGDFGLLGSNKATEEMIKLFPRDCNDLVLDIQTELNKKTGKQIEVMVYGDGAFKDPVGKIWELADPVVSPGYTPGLNGTPNELKLKYLADNDYAGLSGEALKLAIQGHIQLKNNDLKGDMASQGTTPRRLTDLIGSLCDLTSGSGDKGTPIVFIKGYFDNYSV